MRTRERRTPPPLTDEEELLLTELRHQPDHKVGGLVMMTGLDRQTCYKYLAWLEARGLIEWKRGAGPNGGYVRLLPSGDEDPA